MKEEFDDADAERDGRVANGLVKPCIGRDWRLGRGE